MIAATSLGLLMLAQSQRAFLANDGLLIGEWRSAQWVRIAEDLKGSEEPMTLWKLEPTQATSSRECKGFFVGEGVFGHFLRGEPAEWKGTFWGGPKPGYPRPIQPLPRDSKPHLQVIGQILRSKKMSKATPRIESGYRVDLDGDGVQEVLLHATTMTDPRRMFLEKKARYGLLLLRVLEDGKARNIELEFTHDGQDLFNALSIDAIADLDGDGVYEFVLSSDYYEGQSARLMQWNKGRLRMLVDNAAGA